MTLMGSKFEEQGICVQLSHTSLKYFIHHEAEMSSLDLLPRSHCPSFCTV